MQASILERKGTEIENAGVMFAFVDVEGKEVKIVSNGMVDVTKYVDFDCKSLGITEKVSYVFFRKFLKDAAMMKKNH